MATDDDSAEAVMGMGLTHEQMCYRLADAWAENADLRARLDLMTREARLSREATDRAVARLAENEVAFRKMAEAAEAYSRELHKAKAALARVLAVPACRDVGHTEALHIAAGCCDPYESSACTIFAPLDHPRSER